MSCKNRSMIEHALQQSFTQHGLHGQRLVLGVSGGADSLALLCGCLLITPAEQLIVAHLDHQLRPESARDAEWVRQFCHERSIKFVSEKLAPLESTVGLEERARSARYEFLTRIAIEQNSRFVLVAHHADDQAETVLHQLLRGSGLRGAAGIPETRTLAADVTLVRPLLNVTRIEVLKFLEARQQPFLEDLTNTDERLTRNRLRQVVLPLLRESINPQITEALCRFAQQARETADYLKAEAISLLTKSQLDANAGEVQIQTSIFGTAPALLQREAFVQIWMQQNWPRQHLSTAHLDRLLALCATGGRGAIDLPGGIRAELRRGVLRLCASR